MYQEFFLYDDYIEIYAKFYKEDISVHSLNDLKKLIDSASYWGVTIDKEILTNIINFLYQEDDLDEYKYYTTLAYLSNKGQFFDDLKMKIKNYIRGPDFKLDVNVQFFRNVEGATIPMNIKFSIFHKGININYSRNFSILNYKDFEKINRVFLSAAIMFSSEENRWKIKETSDMYNTYKNGQFSLIDNEEITNDQLSDNLERYKEDHPEILDITYDNYLNVFNFNLFNVENNEFKNDTLTFKYNEREKYLNFVPNESFYDSDEYIITDEEIKLDISDIPLEHISKQFLKIYNKMNKIFDENQNRFNEV
jgi:hypothetical protein